jgi:hypothetical protein
MTCLSFSTPFHSQFIDEEGQVQANEVMDRAAEAMLNELVKTEMALRPLRRTDSSIARWGNTPALSVDRQDGDLAEAGIPNNDRGTLTIHSQLDGLQPLSGCRSGRIRRTS